MRWLRCAALGAVLLCACRSDDEERAPAGPGAWHAVPAMRTARGRTSGVLLGDGTVLVTGGNVRDGVPPVVVVPDEVLQTAERFDPASETWLDAGSMNAARWIHASAPLAGNRALVVGGLGREGEALRSSEIFDPDTGWRPTGDLVAARGVHRATTLPCGKVLVAGGWDGTTILRSAELFDPATGQFTPTGSMNHARSWQSTLLLPTGDVLVVGGCTRFDCLATTPSVESYDPTTGRWTERTPFPWGSRMGMGLSSLPEGRVLAVGGCVHNKSCLGEAISTYLYDPFGDTWERGPSMSQPRGGHFVTLLPDGQVLVASGDNISERAIPAELYRSATYTWTATGSMVAAHGLDFAAAQLTDGRVLVAGGSRWDGPVIVGTSDAELWVPGAGR